MSSADLDYMPDRTRKSSSYGNLRNKKAQLGYGENFNYRNQYRGPRERRQEGRAQILISNIHPDVPDQTVRECLFREFKPFGEVSVYLHGRGEGRFATVNFRNPENAVTVKKLYLDRRIKIAIYEKQVYLEFDADYLKSGRSSHSDSHASLSPPGRRGYGKGRVTMGNEYYRDDPRYDIGSQGNFNRNRGVGQRMNKGRNYGGHNNAREDNDSQYNEPSRTLFVGGLEHTITARELERAFQRFGEVEDVYIKRHSDPQGRTYAFVRFNDPDIATQAKIAMTGQTIGRNICKIGYGISTPTKCLWVGGLGPWSSLDELTREFDRFGAIREISYQKGASCAHILYDSLDAASVASREMKGYPLGGADRRLRIDFADPDFASRTRRQPEFERHVDEFSDQGDGKRTSRERDFNHRARKYRHSSREKSFSNKSWSEGDVDADPLADGRGDGDMPQRNMPVRRGRKRSRSPHFEKRKGQRNVSKGKGDAWARNRGFSPERADEVPTKERGRRRSPSPIPRTKRCLDDDGSEYGSEGSDKERTRTARKGSESSTRSDADDTNENGGTAKLETLGDVAKRFAVAWRGALGLKSSAFPIRLHLVGGNPELADHFLRTPSTSGGPTKVLSVTQRLRLDQPKLEEVNRRLTNAGASGHCILLGMPTVQSEEMEFSSNFQSRPLRILVSYFQKKQAAGVIPITASNSDNNNSGSSKDKDEGGILHAFPPCDYSHQQLLKVAPNLGSEAAKEDHLVMILVRGSATI